MERRVRCEFSGVPGAGKTHLAKLLIAAAKADGWKVIDLTDRTYTDAAIRAIKHDNEKVLFIDEVSHG